MLPKASLETLPNGLRLVLVPDSHAESVAFGLFVASGSRHEPAHVAGISHFIEHMLFKGTKTRSVTEITRTIEGHGGNFNAYTSEEGTCFYAVLPCEFLPAAVDVITDMYLHAAIPAAEFERERRVILEEIKMYDDEPDSVASENLSRALFPKNALGAPVAGSAKTLLPLTPADLRAYIHRAYVPAATVAVVVGNFDSADACALVSRVLGRLRPAKPLPFERIDSRVRVTPEIRAARDIQQVQLALGYRTFGQRDPRRYAATVFDGLMGRSMSSRLFQSVRERRGLSYDIRSSLQFFEDAGAWTVTAGLDTKRVPVALAAIRREIDRIRTTKVGAAELRRTKDYLIGNFRLAFEKPSSRLFYYGPCVLAYGHIVSPEEQIARTEAVTAADILAVAKAILDDRNLSISWVTPKHE